MGTASITPCTGAPFLFTAKDKRSCHLRAWPSCHGPVTPDSFQLPWMGKVLACLRYFEHAVSSFNVPPFHLAYSYSAFKSQLKYHFLIAASPDNLPPTTLSLITVPSHTTDPTSRYSSCQIVSCFHLVNSVLPVCSTDLSHIYPLGMDACTLYPGSRPLFILLLGACQLVNSNKLWRQSLGAVFLVVQAEGGREGRLFIQKIVFCP
jgi:hypothetical protein